MKKARKVLKKALTLIATERADTYGPMVENHANIAALWHAYLYNKKTLSASAVANMMELLKIARRLGGSFNLDDYVDGGGYSGIGGEIAQVLEQERNV